MAPPPLDPFSISYQVPRDVLVRNYFRRFLRQPRRLVSVGLILLSGVLFYFAGRDFRYIAFFLGLLLVFLPIAWYRSIARAVDQSPQLTDPRTVTFGPTGVNIVGPNYKAEWTWNGFQSFSEDDSYFYLNVSKSVFGSLIPKSAMTAEQQVSLRQFASHLNK